MELAASVIAAFFMPLKSIRVSSKSKRIAFIEEVNVIKRKNKYERLKGAVGLGEGDLVELGLHLFMLRGPLDGLKSEM